MISGKKLVANAEKHGDANVVDELERAGRSKETVPDSDSVVQGKFAGEDHAYPTKTKDLRFDAESFEMLCQGWIDVSQEIENVFALGDDRKGSAWLFGRLLCSRPLSRSRGGRGGWGRLRSSRCTGTVAPSIPAFCALHEDAEERIHVVLDKDVGESMLKWSILA